MKNYVYSVLDQFVDDIRDLNDFDDVFRFTVRLYLNEQMTFKEFIDFGNLLLDVRLDLLVQMEEERSSL